MNGSIRKNKYILLYVILTLVLLLIFIISFAVGRYNQINICDIPKILFNYVFGGIKETWSAKDEAVVINMRFPRIVTSIMVGSSLAVSGSIYQAVFKNPIASPDTLGITNSASFGAVLGILLGLNFGGVKILAFCFGTLSVLFVLFTSKYVSKGKSETIFLVLIGMVVSSTFSAFLSALKYMADPDNQLPQITYWLMGSFGKVKNVDVVPCIVFMTIGLLPLVFIRWHLNLLALGNEEARAMGINIRIIRGVAIFCATLLTASSAALTGGVSWIGLIIPHITRVLIGNDFRKTIPLNILLGGIFMLIMDDLARCISANEIPISILTSIVGAPVFFAIIIINRRNIAYDD